jgi:hypothetical protein
MPRTRSSKEDKRTPEEKLQQVADSKIDLLIFFKYFDGHRTDGMVGFDINAGPPGSTLHWGDGGIFQIALTKSQFRGKGRKLALLAKTFIQAKIEPPQDLRPQFDQEDIVQIREGSRDRRSPDEKLAAVADILELFVFFKYYDGYKTGGEIGFNANSGPPGSINHKRAYATILASMTESKFREKGKLLSSLAEEFIANDIEPPEYLRPIQPDREVPWSMINEALSGGF